MLKRLAIKNYALIDNLDISFSKELNIMTGETGAGKSTLTYLFAGCDLKAMQNN